MGDLQGANTAYVEDGWAHTAWVEEPRFADPGAMASLLRGAGLTPAAVDTIEMVVAVADADELWDGVLGGSVRTSATVLAQPQAVQDRVRAAVARRAEEYRGRDGLEVPVSVVVGSARR